MKIRINIDLKEIDNVVVPNEVWTELEGKFELMFGAINKMVEVMLLKGKFTNPIVTSEVIKDDQ